MSVCGVPALCFSSPVGSWGHGHVVETNILSQGMFVPSHSVSSTNSPEFRPSGVVFKPGLAMLKGWERRDARGLRGAGDQVGSFYLCQAELSLSLDESCPPLCVPSRAQLGSSRYNMTSGAFEVPAAGAKALK